MDRTEAPSPQRIAEARKEGRVARSNELVVAISLLIGVWLFSVAGKGIVSALNDLLMGVMQSLAGRSSLEAYLEEQLYGDLFPLATSLGSIVFGLLITGVVSSLGQTGFLWASKRKGFDFKRVNPLSGIKRLFSTQGLAELVKSILKLVVVGWVAYGFISSKFESLIGSSGLSFNGAISVWVETANGLLMRVGGAYLLLGIADYVYHRWEHLRSLKMTKQELKQEVREREGHPMIRQYVRSRQRRMAMSRMMTDVFQADVIITNPTHLAIAIQYDVKEMNAPKVLAKGKNLIAERIINIASDEDIPVVQNIPVARALYPVVEIGREIPPDLYMVVAEVLAYVYDLQKKNKGYI